MADTNIQYSFDRSNQLAAFAQKLKLVPEGQPIPPLGILPNNEYATVKVSPEALDRVANAVPLAFRHYANTGGPRDPYLPEANPDPSATIIAAETLAELLMAEHPFPWLAIPWAIFRLIEGGFLGAEIAHVFVPAPEPPTGSKRTRSKKARSKSRTVIEPVPPQANEPITDYPVGLTIPTSSKPGTIYLTPDGKAPRKKDAKNYREVSYLVVWPTQELWDWWKHDTNVLPSLTTYGEQHTQTTSTRSTDAHPAGPFPPDGFSFGKKRARVGRPKVWKLISYLWGLPDRACELDELAEPVWGDDQAAVDANTIGSVRRDANKFFESNGWAFRVKVKGGFISLVDSNSRD